MDPERSEGPATKKKSPSEYLGSFGSASRTRIPPQDGGTSSRYKTSGLSLHQNCRENKRASDAGLRLRCSASRTRTCNPAVTATPALSHWSGLSLHPLRRLSRVDNPRGRALSGRIGENPHPLVSARFPLHRTVLFAGLRSGLPYSRVSENVGFPEFTRSFNPDCSGKLLFLRGLPDDSSHKEVRTCRVRFGFSSNFSYIPFPICRSP